MLVQQSTKYSCSVDVAKMTGDDKSLAHLHPECCLWKTEQDSAAARAHLAANHGTQMHCGHHSDPSTAHKFEATLVIATPAVVLSLFRCISVMIGSMTSRRARRRS